MVMLAGACAEAALTAGENAPRRATSADANSHHVGRRHALCEREGSGALRKLAGIRLMRRGPGLESPLLISAGLRKT